MTRPRRAAIVLLAVLLGAACVDRAPVASVPPEAEFLVAAGDSTYWIRSSSDGLRVRSAPILLTRFETQFHELSIVEEIIDFFDAEFVRERLFGYPVTSADSTLLYADDAVEQAMARWMSANPDETPIDASDEDAPEPESSAADFIEVIDVHGRWVSWAHAIDIDVVGADRHLHERRRGVVDIVTGARATLDSLMSPDDARRVEASGRAALDTMLSVVRTATDERATEARSTLHTFAFDPASFSITDIAGAPAVVFHVAGVNAEGEALELLVPPIAFPQSPAWWNDVRRTLPVWSSDSLTVRWTHGAYAVAGTVDSSRTLLALSLMADTANARPWPIAVVPMPAYQFIALTADTFTGDLRAALIRTFEDASAGDPYATRAQRRPAPRVKRSPLFLNTSVP